MQLKLGARLNEKAAAGPSTRQSVEAQTHRQPTPGSLARTEHELGEIPASTMEKVKDAMARARKADADGDLAACQSALSEIEREIGQ